MASCRSAVGLDEQLAYGRTGDNPVSHLPTGLSRARRYSSYKEAKWYLSLLY